MWWLKHGLLGWFFLSVPWGVATIAFDALVLAFAGDQYTISWQTQQLGRANPVIPFAMTFVAWGLMWHFFRLRDVPLFSADQLVWKAVLGGLMGIAAVELVWTQRGP